LSLFFSPAFHFFFPTRLFGRFCLLQSKDRLLTGRQVLFIDDGVFPSFFFGCERNFLLNLFPIPLYHEFSPQYYFIFFQGPPVLFLCLLFDSVLFFFSPPWVSQGLFSIPQTMRLRVNTCTFYSLRGITDELPCVDKKDDLSPFLAA